MESPTKDVGLGGGRVEGIVDTMAAAETQQRNESKCTQSHERKTHSTKTCEAQLPPHGEYGQMHKTMMASNEPSSSTSIGAGSSSDYPTDAPKQQQQHVCNFSECGQSANMKCGRCKSAFYCGVDHQKKDWRQHKLVCGTSNSAHKSTAKQSNTTDTATKNWGEWRVKAVSVHVLWRTIDV
jgi:hypothetical protein